MPYAIASHAGYCAGVRKAMETAFQAAQEARERNTPCYSLGDLIHNPEAVAALREAGVQVIEQLSEAQTGIVLLRSHGVAPHVLAECRDRGLEVRDCTCTFVRALHEIVHASQIPVLLVGERNHPEVQGTAGWCVGTCYVVESPQEAENLPYMESALAVSQTTFPQEKWEEIIEVLRERVHRLEMRQTICSATQQRQAAARELASRADAMVVVGGKNSANTRKLYAACAAICPRTCLVERAADIPPHFANIHTELIGIAAGASTPDWSFKEVVTRMNDIEHIDQEPQTLTMKDIEDTLVRIRPGQTVTGTVIQITEDEVCVSIGYKSDGIIKKSDLVVTDVKMGDELEVEVVKVNDGEGNVLLSQRNIVTRRVWDELKAKFEKGETIEATGKEAVKGGLLATLADADIRAFIPASQLDVRFVEKIDKFVGQPMTLKILDMNDQKKRIVASRKEVLAKEVEAKKAAAWANLVEGSVVKGVVRRFADFGAFVDLGGVDGLIHITDLSWSHVKHPSDVLTPNQEIEVKIMKMDRERERIQLGYKQLTPQPWDNIEEKYPVGAIFERPVVRIRNFGAFVELEPGVDGLVHISQVAKTRVAKVEDVLSEGQMVQVKVLTVDPQAKRISLSIRATMEDEAPVAEEPAAEAPVAEEPAAE